MNEQCCPNCGHRFEYQKVVKPEKKEYDKVGRGLKACAKCGQIVGAKTSVCPGCNTPFEKKEKNTEVKIYNELTRGRKQCPHCDTIVGGRIRVCPTCNTEFEKKVAKAKAVMVYPEAGPGRKQCPECNIFVAARTRKCICGHDFTEDVPETETTETTTENPPEVQTPSESNEVKNAKKILAQGFEKAKMYLNQFENSRTDIDWDVVKAGIKEMEEKEVVAAE